MLGRCALVNYGFVAVFFFFLQNADAIFF
jgi:hypothetical protein